MIGERLGKWVIYKELGRGGMGRVYLAQEEIGGRKAALKVLAAELAQDGGFLERFQREIETLRLLDHPNIVRFYEAGYENGLYFYAMEYVDGSSLEKVLEEQKRLDWKEVLDIALQLCPALKHAHDHGIIHRDIKPANLLRGSDGLLKLTDFGIAKVFAGGHLTATGGVVGTAEYLSPEQAAGKPVTKRSDLYSLGVVLYTLVTGKNPFVGSDFLDLLHKHRYAQFDPPGRIIPEMPYELDEIICKLLAKDPAERPADALVLGRQLEALRLKLQRKSKLTQVDTGETVDERRPGNRGEPGVATLMSHLMRQTLEREQQGGFFNRLFNRPVVLVFALLLCLAGIVWTFWPLSPETMFQRGAALMASQDYSDMERAWHEYLEPLQRDYPDFERDQVDRFRQKLEAARNEGKEMSEASRFYHQGERLRQTGDLVGAQRVWENLIRGFGEVESEREWVRRARERLEELKKSARNEARWKPIKAALQRAGELQRRGKREQAEVIWQGLEDLYRSDPTAAFVLEEIRKARGR